jgi:hypothetical protein
MTDTNRQTYVAAFALGLCGGVTLERYRAPRGGVHKMRLVHHASAIAVERAYDDSVSVHAVLDDLTVQLKAKLADNGLSWNATQHCPQPHWAAERGTEFP